MAHHQPYHDTPGVEQYRDGRDLDQLKKLAEEGKLEPAEAPASLPQPDPHPEGAAARKDWPKDPVEAPDPTAVPGYLPPDEDPYGQSSAYVAKHQEHEKRVKAAKKAAATRKKNESKKED